MMRLAIRGNYPPDWREIAARVKADADHRCIRCGHRDGDVCRRGVKPMRNRAAIEAGMTTRVGYTKTLVPCDARCSHPRDGKMRALTVHHLDGDKGNCRWWNLLALCQLCHLTIQGKVIPERPFLWEHSDWFKPYAAGFYAWWFGELEIDRTHAEAMTDYYLQLGQPWLYERVAP